MAFWKRLFGKQDVLELPETVSDMGVPEVKQSFHPLAEPVSEPSFSPQQFPSFHPQASSFSHEDAELRLISAKLDTIKAVLDVINQRLEKLERGKGDDVVRWR